MTDEELRVARIAEAKARTTKGTNDNVLLAMADMWAENWTPPEPVDPDLLAAREWLMIHGPYNNGRIERGDWDAGDTIRAYLAGCTRGREGAKGLVDDLDVVRIILHAYQRTLKNESGWGDMSYLKGSYDNTVGFQAAVNAYRAALAAAKGERV